MHRILLATLVALSIITSSCEKKTSSQEQSSSARKADTLYRNDTAYIKHASATWLPMKYAGPPIEDSVMRFYQKTWGKFAHGPTNCAFDSWKSLGGASCYSKNNVSFMGMKWDKVYITFYMDSLTSIRLESPSPRHRTLIPIISKIWGHQSVSKAFTEENDGVNFIKKAAPRVSSSEWNITGIDPIAYIASSDINDAYIIDLGTNTRCKLIDGKARLSKIKPTLNGASIRNVYLIPSESTMQYTQSLCNAISNNGYSPTNIGKIWVDYSNAGTIIEWYSNRYEDADEKAMNKTDNDM